MFFSVFNLRLLSFLIFKGLNVEFKLKLKKYLKMVKKNKTKQLNIKHTRLKHYELSSKKLTFGLMNFQFFLVNCAPNRFY